MGSRGPTARKDTALVAVYQGDDRAPLELSKNLAEDLRVVSLEVGMNPSRLLDQLVRSYLNRRLAPRNQH